MCHRNTGGCSNIHHGEHGDHDHNHNQCQSAITTSVPDELNIQKDKWVINISSKPLTAVQESLLSNGPNFTAVPRGPPIVECVTAVEKNMSKVSAGGGRGTEGRSEGYSQEGTTPNRISQMKNKKP